MMTIEQALAATPGGFKLVEFNQDENEATWRDRNGNQIYQSPNGFFFAQYNGEWSGNIIKTIDEAVSWLNDKKKRWGNQS